MTAALAYEQLLENKHVNRMRREDRALDVVERREAFAESQIGELVRDGRPVFYVFPVGGKYREGNRVDLIAFLLRNNYA